MRQVLNKMERVPQEELQPVCRGRHFDSDTGECTFFKKEKLDQCSKYPHCMLKVGEPVLRLKVKIK